MVAEQQEAPPKRGLTTKLCWFSVGDAGLDPATPTV
jgi:hypothetical protein